MKKLFPWICKALFVALLGGGVWRCFHPEVLVGMIVYGLLLGIFLLGPVCACCAIALASPGPSRPPAAKTSKATPLAAMLLGALLGWWLGRPRRDHDAGDS